MDIKSYLIVLIFLVFSPSIIFADALSNSDIDKYLKAVPAVSGLLDQLAIEVKADRSVRKKISIAQMEARKNRELIKIFSNKPAIDQIEDRVKQAGFSDLSSWALTADRIEGVIMSTQWVIAAASIDADAPIKIGMNIFAYIDNEKNDLKWRNKYKRQILDMCKKICFDTTDSNVVKARYTDILKVLD